MSIFPNVSSEGKQTAFCDDLVRIALDVGEGLLKNGEEVAHVEYSIDVICRTYGAVHVEVFTIPSLIVTSVRMANGDYSSQTRRIYQTGNNLSRLEAYSNLSRRIAAEKPSIAEADAMIRAVKQKADYPIWLLFLGAALASGGFAVFFGGSWRDCIAAVLVGIVVTALDRIHSAHFRYMAKTLMISFVSGFLACFLVWIGLGQNKDAIIIGTIMLLIPGLALGNALRDLLGGDTLAGILEIVQSVIKAAMIAIGYALALILMSGALA